MAQERISKIRDWALKNARYSNIHGVEHWDRVYQNGQRLASPDVDILVVGAFAYLHDVCRENDGVDINHGLRASMKINEIRNTLLSSFSDEQIELLQLACKYHTTRRKMGHPTIDACFDADRLDLGRVGITPNPKKMATKTGARIAKKNQPLPFIKRILVCLCWDFEKFFGKGK